MEEYLYDDPRAAFAEAERRIQKAFKTDSDDLDLSGFGLTALPDSLRHLVPLKKLNLASAIDEPTLATMTAPIPQLRDQKTFSAGPCSFSS